MVLMAARAMNSAMKHLKPYFQSGEAKRKGKFIIGENINPTIRKRLVSTLQQRDEFHPVRSVPYPFPRQLNHSDAVISRL